MTRSVEQVALRLMKALKEECEKEPDRTKRRAAVEIVRASNICESQGEFERVIAFIGPRNKCLINAIMRPDRTKMMEPNQAGYAWIESQEENAQIEAQRRKDRNLKIYGLIAAIVTALIAALALVLRK
jgi:hypothetical protein